MSNSPQHELNSAVIHNLKQDRATEISSELLAKEIAEAADDKKAADIVLLNVSSISYLADYFVIATGFSTTQVKAICDSVEQQLEEKYQVVPLRVQGKTDGRWVVIDYGEVIVHILMEEEREYYDLEAFWGHAERAEYEPSS